MDSLMPPPPSQSPPSPQTQSYGRRLIECEHIGDAWPNVTQFIEHLTDFFVKDGAMVQQVQALLAEDDSIRRDFPFAVNLQYLHQYHVRLGHSVVNFPKTTHPVISEALVKAQLLIRGRAKVDNPSGGEWEKWTVKGELWDKLERHWQPGMAQEEPYGDSPKDLSQARITRVMPQLLNPPPFPGIHKRALSDVNASDIDRLVQLGGTVIRCSPVRMMETKRYFRCMAAGCGYISNIAPKLDSDNMDIDVSSYKTVCPKMLDTGPCNNTKFKEILRDYGDYQEIRIQESTSQLAMGAIPRALTVLLERSLTSNVFPGDEITVVGVLLSRVGKLVPDLKPEAQISLRALSLTVTNANDDAQVWDGVGSGSMNMGMRNEMKKEFSEFWARAETSEKERVVEMNNRKKIVQSVCPKLCGMEILKLGLLLTLIGGRGSDIDGEGDGDGDNDDANNPQNPPSEEDSPEKHSHGFQAFWKTDASRSAKAPKTLMKTRSQSHMLMIGDPGTGKSQLLRFAVMLSPRSIMTTGVGTSSAGLTCSAVREKGGKNGDWTLEAGALVLADRGVCAIDEFGTVKEEDRTKIHEAMEQQTLSVAKAGLVCKLNCRTTIIATTNPRGKYDTQKSVTANTGIGSPLISRFDLPFVMMESTNKERDEKIAQHLLDAAIVGGDYDKMFKKRKKGALNQPMEEAEEEIWSLEKLRGYIATVKSSFKPLLTYPARQVLLKYYGRCRKEADYSNPITVRLLESLIRLSQAHARLMYRNEVLLNDAIAVVILMQATVNTVGGLGDGKYFNVDDDERLPEFDCTDDTLGDHETFEMDKLKVLVALGLRKKPDRRPSQDDDDAVIIDEFTTTAPTAQTGTAEEIQNNNPNNLSYFEDDTCTTYQGGTAETQNNVVEEKTKKTKKSKKEKKEKRNREAD
ncbi:hypothetical protein TrST_g1756 [Triparma strigata]|uniref:MCM C-terminal AAA(+) ATPase domain-containing protein n=1 Tax=Triparma strigata TaxID=1606541 RepID=A0A9W7C7Y9_9STRA|nr:hypothetical protein TrST_g1756 [Triparma strigata]